MLNKGIWIDRHSSEATSEKSNLERFYSPYLGQYHIETWGIICKDLL